MKWPKSFIVGNRYLTWNDSERGYDFFDGNKKMGIFPADKIEEMILTGKHDKEVRQFLGLLFDAMLRELVNEENL